MTTEATGGTFRSDRYVESSRPQESVVPETTFDDFRTPPLSICDRIGLA